MGRIYTTIDIAKPIGEVFTYVTTPDHWLAWHVTARSVSGPTDHSLLPGETVNEELETMGQRRQAVWTVQERAAPDRWVIAGQLGGGGSATITYTLQATAGGTTFAREVVYELPGPLALVDGLLIRPRMESEATASLRRLKEVLEQPGS
jgi:uncharacterized protein YndB with AHSA1/START domain